MSYVVKLGKNNSIIFNINKRLESNAFSDLENDIDHALEQRYSCYIFCFEKMEFLASRTVGIMISLRKRLDEDIPIYLVSPSLYIIKILNILNITDLFHIVDNIDNVYDKNIKWQQN